jgi:hypothetical protein
VIDRHHRKTTLEQGFTQGVKSGLFQVIAKKGASVDDNDRRMGGRSGFRQVNVHPVPHQAVVRIIDIPPDRGMLLTGAWAEDKNGP